jgi:tRNA(adenine34) deaminase
MCGGALAWAQLGQLIYGASDPRRGYLHLAPKTSHPKTQILSGILEQDCLQLIQDFFREKR